MRHDGGATQSATFAGLTASRGGALLRFDIAGVRTVTLRATASRKRGRFVESGMQWWFVDELTLERLEGSAAE